MPYVHGTHLAILARWVSHSGVSTMKNNMRQRPVADEPVGIVISGGSRDEVLPRVWAYIWGPVPDEDENSSKAA
jgi:hypothetical protein